VKLKGVVMRQRLSCVFLFGAVAGMPVMAQTTLNPDISVIPRFLIVTDDGGKLAEGKREFSQPDFQLQELELGVQAYLNPYARADVFLSLQGPDLETASLGLEEAYMTVLRGLPLDLNLRAGKYRVEFGKLNMVHPHAQPFVTQPLVEERFLGTEGLNDLGISVSILLPTGDVYTRLTADVLRGLSVAHAAGIEDTSGTKLPYAFSSRLSSFFTLSDFSELEAGLSCYSGIHDPYHAERFWYWNVDFKYKYRPSTYTSLVVQGEGLLNLRRATQDQQLVPFLDDAGQPESREVRTSGMYLYADYQVMKIFSVGSRYDWSEDPYRAENRAWALSLFTGYYPVEETIGVRLQYQYTRTETPGLSQSVNSIGVQFLFSLGPHKAHPF
jgi:hypothetical protein